MPKCPFLSGYENFTDSTSGDIYSVFTQQDCIEEECQLWDVLNSRCSLSLSDILIHLHNQHRHVKVHVGIESESGGMFVNDYPVVGDEGDLFEIAGSKPLPPEQVDPAEAANTLMKEYLNTVDCDGNGKIYGTDFKISDPPFMLQAIQNAPNFPNPETEMTMQEYRDEVGF